jgi:antitoxin (DNA-binding transcriptional repressor) of toxin-antitoxin stability system
MAQTISKSKFKPRALEYFRKIQETGEELVLTDHGKPVLKITAFKADPAASLWCGSRIPCSRPVKIGKP